MASGHVSSTMRFASKRGHSATSLMVVALFLAAASQILSTTANAFGVATPGGGMNRDQKRGNLHTRADLPRQVLEVKDPETKDAVPKEPAPEHRVPYTMHIVSHFPNNKHIHEGTNTKRMIEDKITESFQRFEDLIRHIEVNLQVSEGFHAERPGSFEKPHHKGEVDLVAVEIPSDDIYEPDPKEEFVQVEHTGSKTIAPYVFKVTVSLHNGRTIVLTNAEKHAMPTLIEALDHMVDVVRKALREEKDKDIDQKRKHKDVVAVDLEDDQELINILEAQRITEELHSKE